MRKAMYEPSKLGLLLTFLAFLGGIILVVVDVFYIALMWDEIACVCTGGSCMCLGGSGSVIYSLIIGSLITLVFGLSFFIIYEPFKGLRVKIPKKNAEPVTHDNSNADKIKIALRKGDLDI